MTGRRTTSQKQPPAPPKDAEAGAALVRAAIVKLFDNGDGAGANWPLLLESLYRAGFKIYDDNLKGIEAGARLMRRVHAGAEMRVTDGYADGDGVNGPVVSGGENSPPGATPGLKGPKPLPH